MVDHAEGVLEAGLFLVAEYVIDLTGAVLVAEDEQPATDERLDASRAAQSGTLRSALISLSAT